jgi:hypothetical protein
MKRNSEVSENEVTNTFSLKLLLSKSRSFREPPAIITTNDEGQRSGKRATLIGLSGINLKRKFSISAVGASARTLVAFSINEFLLRATRLR